MTFFKKYEREIKRFGFNDNEINFSNLSEQNQELLCLFIKKINDLQSDIRIFKDCKDGSAQQTVYNMKKFRECLE